jgi:hypothetical protein
MMPLEKQRDKTFGKSLLNDLEFTHAEEFKIKISFLKNKRF